MSPTKPRLRSATATGGAGLTPSHPTADLVSVAAIAQDAAIRLYPPVPEVFTDDWFEQDDRMQAARDDYLVRLRRALSSGTLAATHVATGLPFDRRFHKGTIDTSMWMLDEVEAKAAQAILAPSAASHASATSRRGLSQAKIDAILRGVKRDESVSALSRALGVSRKTIAKYRNTALKSAAANAKPPASSWHPSTPVGAKYP